MGGDWEHVSFGTLVSASGWHMTQSSRNHRNVLDRIETPHCVKVSRGCDTAEIIFHSFTPKHRGDGDRSRRKYRIGLHPTKRYLIPKNCKSPQKRRTLTLTLTSDLNGRIHVLWVHHSFFHASKTSRGCLCPRSMNIHLSVSNNRTKLKHPTPKKADF